MKPAQKSRAALVKEVRDRLLAEDSPRLTMVIIVCLAGCGAFLLSVLALWSGLHSMPIRYGLAAIAGYVVFAGLLRAWIGWKRRLGRAADAADAASWPGFDLGSSSGSSGGSTIFGGGRSGGGGATASWSAQGEASAPVVVPLRSASSSPAASTKGKWSDALDGDDKTWPLILAVVLALAAFIAVGFVIYSAPTLLAEVTLDAGLMAGVYRRLSKQDAGHWIASVWRHTWQPALFIVVCAIALGYALQLVAPEARSIGGVIHALTG